MGAVCVFFASSVVPNTNVAALLALSASFALAIAVLLGKSSTPGSTQRNIEGKMHYPKFAFLASGAAQSLKLLEAKFLNTAAKSPGLIALPHAIKTTLVWLCRLLNVGNATKQPKEKLGLVAATTTKQFFAALLAPLPPKELVAPTNTDTALSAWMARSKFLSIATSWRNTSGGIFSLTNKFITKMEYVMTMTFQILSCGVIRNQAGSALRTKSAGVLVSFWSTGTR